MQQLFLIHGEPFLMPTSSSANGGRNRVDISTTEMARHWRKHFRTTKEKIEAAIAKIGDNPETVQKELRLADESRNI